jgi:SAM-dependent methyltransferase
MYDEYLNRRNYAPSAFLHLWLNKKIILYFLKETGQDLKDLRVLEIGAGVGYSARVFEQMGARNYLGVEPTTALRNYVASMGFSVHGDSLPNLISVDKDSQDLIFSLHVLEHAPNYIEARDWVKEMLRVAAPKSFLVICAPDIRSWRDHFWNADWSHGWPTTPDRIVQVATDLGASKIVAKSFYLGHPGFHFQALAKILLLIIPVKLIDWVSLKLIGRPLASGFRDAMLFGLSVVILQKNDSL